jgi:hypothetical protein
MTRGTEKVEVGQLRKKIESIHFIIKRSALPDGNFLILKIREDEFAEFVDSNGMISTAPVDFIFEFTEIVK